ncbi:MAG: hypothetical protein ACRD3W_03750, partial [Terriglobales bacterium]
MGTSFTNFQVRSTDFDRVVKAMRSCHALPCYVSKPSSLGWVSVYPREVEKAEEEQVDTLALSLSRIVDGAVFAVRVYDSTNFYYVLYESGRFLDNYESDPGAAKGKELPPKGGNMRVIHTFCVPGTTLEVLQNTFLKKSSGVLEAASVFWHLLRNEKEKAFNSTKIFRGENLAAQFGDRLGVPGERIAVGYRAIRDGDVKDKDLILVKEPTLVKAQAVSKIPPPVLITQTQDRSRRVVDMEERPPAPTDAPQMVAMSLVIGDEILWDGTVLNAGGPSKGIRLTLASAALEDGSIIQPYGRVQPWQPELDEESDYVERPDDESRWPYFASFQRQDKDWVAEMPEIEYSQGMTVGLSLDPTKAGHARLDLAIAPLDSAGSSTAKFRIDMKITDAEKPAAPPNKGTAMR